ncbi:MAG: endolytic transglycosylase MltG, partial [Dethiosulfatibacter sp.]|nr:endolytic transglycosylase MltG [Dethiosulfatibacter sp.]
MRRLINAIRDFFYEATDYAIILTVVIAIAIILIWRFNILFSFDVNKDPIQSSEPAPTTEQIPISTEDPNNPDPTEPSNGDYFEVTLVIPPGSSAQSIGDILVNNGLIGDRRAWGNHQSDFKIISITGLGWIWVIRVFSTYWNL